MWTHGPLPSELPKPLVLYGLPGSHSWMGPQKVEQEFRPGNPFPGEARTKFNGIQASLLSPWSDALLIPLPTHTESASPDRHAEPQGPRPKMLSSCCHTSGPRWRTRPLGLDSSLGHRGSENRLLSESRTETQFWGEKKFSVDKK